MSNTSPPSLCLQISWPRHFQRRLWSWWERCWDLGCDLSAWRAARSGGSVEVYALPPLLYYFSSFLLFYPCSILLFRFYTFISCAMQHSLLLFHSQHLHKLLCCLVRVFASFLACFPRYWDTRATILTRASSCTWLCTRISLFSNSCTVNASCKFHWLVWVAPYPSATHTSLLALTVCFCASEAPHLRFKLNRLWVLCSSFIFASHTLGRSPGWSFRRIRPFGNQLCP